MLNVFQMADNDQSLIYLGQIFGNVGFALAGSGSAMLANMFKTFNSILLTVGVIFVVYVTIVGVLSTAHEGEFLGGKKWNSLWVPLRMLGGITALFPTQSGYCALQVIIMWLVVQGVGAADMVWKTALDYVGSGGLMPSGTSTTKLNVSTMREETTDITNQDQGPGAILMQDKLKLIFNSLVCQATAVKTSAKGGLGDKSLVARSQLIPNAEHPTGYNFGRVSDDPITADECGTMTWINELSPAGDPNSAGYDANSSDAAISAATGSAMMTLVPVMEVLANAYVNAVIDEASCWDPCPPELKPFNFCAFDNKYLGFKRMSDPTAKQSCPLFNSGTGWGNVASYAGSNFLPDSLQMLAGYANNYKVNNAMKQAQELAGKTGSSVNTSLADAELRAAQNNGWIFAGAFYYKIANTQSAGLGDFTRFYGAIQATDALQNYNAIGSDGRRKYRDLITPIHFYCAAWGNSGARTPPPECDKGTGGGSLGLFKAAQDAMNLAKERSGGELEVKEGGGGPGGYWGGPNNIARSMIHDWMKNISGQKANASGSAINNPIIEVAAFGKSMLIAAQVLFGIMFAIVLVLGAIQTYVIALGTTVNPMAGVAGAMLSYFIPFMFFFILYLFSIGALLGVYVPLIPYLIFTFGAVGWFIAVVDAMIAGPIIALGILGPGGQNEILGHADPAAKILLNILFRPTFMIFGLIAAMFVSWVVIKMINAAFIGVVGSIAATSGGIGLMEAFLYIMAYAGLVVTALNKCFALIHMIPDKILRWIGGHAEGFGEAEAAEAVKGKVTAGAEAGGAAMRGVGGAGEGVASEGKKEAQEMRTQKKGPGVTS